MLNRYKQKSQARSVSRYDGHHRENMVGQNPLQLNPGWGEFIIFPYCKSAVGAAVCTTHDNNGSLHAAD